MRTYLIPARGGSRGIPGKNLAMLGGHPLLRWTVEAAKVAAAGYPVVVTSDDAQILKVAEALGATAHARPAHLADDQATMRDVVREYLKTHPEVPDVVLLYPTVPFRRAETVKAALAVFDGGTMSGPHRSLMSVHAHKGRPFGGVQILDGKLFFQPEAAAYYRRQDTPTLYHANGAIYVISRDVIDSLNTQLFNAETVPFVMHGDENLDIDEPYDLDVARALVNGGKVQVPAAWTPLSDPALLKA